MGPIVAPGNKNQTDLGPAPPVLQRAYLDNLFRFFHLPVGRF
jgi:hypothetical protein